MENKMFSIPLQYTKKLTEGIKENPDVVNLARGDSEFQTPKPILDYLCRIIYEKGDTTDFNVPVGKWTHYEKGQGSKKLREAIARKYEKESNLRFNPANIIVTQGGMNAIYLAFKSILNEGDHILIPDPCYVAYEPIAKHLLNGIELTRIPLTFDNRFVLDKSILDSYKKENTKAVILTSPMNPTGTIYTEKELKIVLQWAKDNNVIIIHDENHEKEVYENAMHLPISKFDKELNNTVLLNSFSRLGMGGWRLGWMIANDEIIKHANLINSFTNMTINTFVQETGRYVLDNYSDLNFDKYFEHYEQKRDRLYKILKEIPGFEPILPDSTCYMYVDISEFYKDNIYSIESVINLHVSNKSALTSEEKLLLENSVSYKTYIYILETAKVGCIPGISYGPNSDHYVRFSFSVKEEAIIEAGDRMRKMIQLGEIS